MNEKLHPIHKLFSLKGISEYKIVYKHEKGLFFNHSFNKICCENKNLKNFFISFIKDGKFSEFSLSNIDNIKKVSQLIDLCLENSVKSNIDFLIENAENSIFNQNKLKNIYKSFDKDLYRNWLINQYEITSSKTALSLNFAYTFNISKSHVLKKNDYIESYSGYSHCVCMENINYKKMSFVNDMFLDEKISEKLILELLK